MSDLYFEQLVTRKKTGRDYVKAVLLIFLTVIAGVAGLLIPLGFIFAFIFGVTSYWVIANQKIDYDYLYVNGELDITKVFAQSRRKKVRSIDVRQLELLAPVKSHRMDHYNSNTKMPVYDYSSGDPSHKVYMMIISIESRMSKVLLELDEEMLDAIGKYVPRRVFND